MNIGPCRCCTRIRDLRAGVCAECPAPQTDGGEEGDDE